MEKVLQILAVFVLLSLVIHRIIRGREPRYQPYNYLTRLRAPIEVRQQMRAAVFEAGIADVEDGARQLRFLYKPEGSLIIYWQEKEMQWLAAPLNCTGMAFDPEDGRLYLEAEGYLFVYGI